jgi:hypothetical protein
MIRSVNMSECPSCGRTLAQDMMFCPYCGTKMSTLGSESEDSTDVISDIISLAKPVGDEGDTGIRTIIFTRRQIIIVRMTDRDRDFMKRMVEDGANARGKAFYGRWEDAAKPQYSYARRYLDMTPETALNESAGNYAIPYDEIFSVKVAVRADEDGAERYAITIESEKGTLAFMIGLEHEFRDIMLERFGPKLHW